MYSRFCANPWKKKQVTISRAATTLTYPCNFMLVAAMNPCPCGYLTDPKHECRCTPHQIQRYRAKISGPLLDRIDIHVDVPTVPYRDLNAPADAESSERIRDRVLAARQRQIERFGGHKTLCNAQLDGRQLKRLCPLDAPSGRLLETAIDRLGLSARAYQRVIKIARTIADLAGSHDIDQDHVSEAIQYRSLDRRRGEL